MLALLLAACTTTDVAQSFEIDRLRILAVAAEPAEPRPGDTVRFSSLVVSPEVPVALTTWFVCFVEESSDFGCAVDPSLTDDLAGLDPSTLTPEELAALYEELAAAGLVGVEPWLPPTWTVPDDALDGLDATEALEGRLATVTLTAVPDQPTVDEGDVEIAYKRVPVSLAATPNHNPAVTGFTVDGVSVPLDARLHLDRGQAYDIGVELAADAVETYTYLNLKGVEETRTEEPYFSWYLQEGAFEQAYSLYPNLAIRYTVPAAPTRREQSLWVVMRDRRGGMAWAELAFTVEG